MSIFYVATAKWYVIYTYPNYEKKVRNMFSQLDITCFLPVHKVTRIWSDRKKTVERPLFPNYIFVYADDKTKYKALNVYGVSRYVSSNGNPVTISENEIDTIKKMLVVPGMTVEQHIEAGDLVEITDGAFDGLKGVVFKKSSKSRFAVKIHGINQFISIEVNLSSIRKYESKL
jgi:transcription antitermination factor NusG